MKRNGKRLLSLLTAMVLLFSAAACGDIGKVDIDSVDVSQVNDQLEELMVDIPSSMMQTKCSRCGGSGHTNEICDKCGGSGKFKMPLGGGLTNYFISLSCGRCSGTGYKKCGACDGGYIETIDTDFYGNMGRFYHELADLLKYRSKLRENCKRSKEELPLYSEFCEDESKNPARSGDLFCESCYTYDEVSNYVDRLERVGFRFMNAHVYEKAFLKLRYLRGKEEVNLTLCFSSKGEYASRYVTASYSGSLFPAYYKAATDVNALMKDDAGSYTTEIGGGVNSPRSWCSRCYGLGTCPDCYGSGTIRNMFGTGDYHTCTTCGGSGACPKCGGHG